ncbi:hypothetical protein E2320_022243 [Naja naja]|nr:hypothetical protein E2320_022243 [Naja naja]
MRYNERELLSLSRQPAEKAAEVLMRAPKKGSEEQCQEWIEVLRKASYEFMRSSLIFYRNEIQKMTGKDPLEQYGISEEARFQLGARKL